MYNQYLRIRPNNDGVYTIIDIPANVPILEFIGDIKTDKEIKGHMDVDKYLQMGPDLFLSPVEAINGHHFMSHSCDPNSMLYIVGNRVIVYSLYVIPANHNITYDYSTSSTDTYDSWKMDCVCGSYKCRKIISGYQYLNDEIKSDYEKRGMVPMFISMPNLFSKRW